MFMTDINDVKIYNLSAGKSIPDWIVDRRKRAKLKKKLDSRRQIELIQEFDMPGVATSIKMSPDNQYIIATGTYKPRVKCFEVANLSIKFERCFDSEVTAFEILSDDYSKMVFLQNDRFVELHAAHGRHYRLRIPRFGRDIKYHPPSCDLCLVGTSSDIYRLNLERGQFLQPYVTDASCLNCCAINPEHHLLTVGTQEGTVEAWDPRDRKRVGILDVGMKISNYKDFPSVTALNFKNGLFMGVGTASGHVLLYDIRSKEPMLIKDHLNQLPIKRIEYNPNMNAVYSMDLAILKIWDENSGNQMAYIESQTDFNDFCTIPNTGMFFIAQESEKMLTYYIPSMGPAPKWCSFLDNIAEEIESEIVENIYDDYQFVTRKELEDLGLDHLIGTNLLRAYMHGYFINVHLYKKAKSVIEPFTFDRFRKEKLNKEIEALQSSRLLLNANLPKINKDLAIKLLNENTDNNNKKNSNLLEDERFKIMFENPDFTIDKNAEEYKMLLPVLNHLEKSKIKETKKQRNEISYVEQIQNEENQPEKSNDDDYDDKELFEAENVGNDNDDDDNDTDSSEDNTNELTKEMKKAYKEIKFVKRRKEQLEEEEEEEDDDEDDENHKKNIKHQDSIKMIELDNVTGFNVNKLKMKMNRKSLKDRLQKELSEPVTMTSGSMGNHVIQFTTKRKSKDMKKREYDMKKHRQERKELSRSTASLKLKRMNFK